MMRLKVYADRMSQPSRAVLIFCKVNGIAFEEIKVDISKRQQLSPEYAEINPMQKVPSIVDGRFKLFESHAILSYLASAFPGVAHHWFPTDLSRRAKINSVLDWHHSNLRHGAVTFVVNTVLAPGVGLPLNSQLATEGEKLLSSSLSKLENFWLKGDGQFLLGGFKPSIADLSLVCEIMQLEVLDEKDRERILVPYKKVLQWIEDTRYATRPHFDEVHNILYKAKRKFQEKRSKQTNNETGPTDKITLPSKI
ncbi:Glutathione S-transferase [Quillaja saponaria]|uniref:glutathione transferase n=1 Tax=Quillaja saponaria TaxID=32244 RepID=A0AAD7P7A0_QUISA|nr:Glutathione S-transferase [Quillaja saponaria]